MLHESSERSQSKSKDLPRGFFNKHLHIFSSSEKDGEITYPLHIKPSAAYTLQSSHSSKCREETKLHHRESEKRRRKRKHDYREKHRSEKQVLYMNNNEWDYKAKGRYYGEQIQSKGNYNLQHTSKQMRMERKDKKSRNEDCTLRDRSEVYKVKAVTNKYIKSKRISCTQGNASKKLKMQQSKEYCLESGEDYYSFDRSNRKGEGKRYKETDALDSVLQDKTRICAEEIIDYVGKNEQQNIQEYYTKREKTKRKRPKTVYTESEISQCSEQLQLDMEYAHLRKKSSCERNINVNKHLLSQNELITMSDSSADNTYPNVDQNDEDSHSGCDEAESISCNELVHNIEHLKDGDCSSKEITNKWLEKPNFYLEYMQEGKLLDNNEVQEELNELQEDEVFPPYYPAIEGCRSINEFQLLNHVEEGTYGVVYRATDKHSNEIVAVKRLKMEREREGFPITSLREINTLLKGQHPNVVTVREIVVGNGFDKIYIVMDYVERDLKSLMEIMRQRKRTFNIGEVKCLLKQLLCAMAYLHDNWILHRDLKTSNILLSSKGILKVGDFGLAREYGSPLKAYTPVVVTLWYRAPELLLCTKQYSTPIDMWSVGCIFGELLLMKPVFQGKSEIDQLHRIFKMLGTPNEEIWPGFNKLPAVKQMKLAEYPTSHLKSRFYVLSVIGLTLLQRFLTYDPVQRISAEKALEHPYFNETPLPIDPSMFPTWSNKNELGTQKNCEQLTKNNDNSSSNVLDLQGAVHISATDNRILPMGSGFTLKF